MALFEVSKRGGKEQDSAILKKVNAKPKTTTVRGGGLLGKINEIKKVVESSLGKYKEEYITIQDEEVLSDYIDECVKKQCNFYRYRNNWLRPYAR